MQIATCWAKIKNVKVVSKSKKWSNIIKSSSV